MIFLLLSYAFHLPSLLAAALILLISHSRMYKDNETNNLKQNNTKNANHTQMKLEKMWTHYCYFVPLLKQMSNLTVSTTPVTTNSVSVSTISTHICQPTFPLCEKNSLKITS